MANERIRLEFVEFDPDLAHTMVCVARSFAVSKPDGRPGMRHGTAAVLRDGSRLYAYWTPARVVVVREIPADVGGGE